MNNGLDSNFMPLCAECLAGAINADTETDGAVMAARSVHVKNIACEGYECKEFAVLLVRIGDPPAAPEPTAQDEQVTPASYVAKSSGMTSDQIWAHACKQLGIK